jgi:hypothetical protein
VVGAAALIFSPWRMKRLLSFLDPWEIPPTAAIKSCRVYTPSVRADLGEGFAKGQQKLFYLPYPYSDFIFAVVGEELGLIGTLGNRRRVRASAVARNSRRAARARPASECFWESALSRESSCRRFLIFRS